jgi:IS30 family transposase
MYLTKHLLRCRFNSQVQPLGMKEVTGDNGKEFAEHERIA